MIASTAAGIAKTSRCSRAVSERVTTVRRISTESQDAPGHGSRIRSQRKFIPKKTILSGIQPTGVPHLGNYLGALRQWKTLQAEKIASKTPNNHSLYFSIVDLHALTGRSDGPRLFQQTRQTFASLLAIGLDPAQSVLFVQSKVPCHTQLMWVLSTIASTGYLSRMTQWKSKLGLADDVSLDSDSATDKLKLGLFSYPVLQAADILLYQPTHVPVGEDQTQHIEFARHLAKSFNAHYGGFLDGRQLFNQPKLMLSPAKRIMSLRDPQSKMSKSDANPMSRILITDSPDDIHMKLRGAVTDSIEGISYDPETRPGVSNLVQILKHVSRNEATCEEIAADNASLSMRAFKEHVAHNVINELKGIRDNYDSLMKPSDQSLNDAMSKGSQKANARAGSLFAKVEQIIGLRDFTADNKVSKRAQPSEDNKADDGQQSAEAEKTSDSDQSPEAKKAKVLREQKAEEEQAAEEPDVLPQADQGVDRPLAS